MCCPMLGDAVAGFFHRTAKRQCGFADDGITTHCIKDRDFVFMRQPGLSTFVVQDNNVICFGLDIVGYNTRTALAKGLNNLSGLWARATSGTAAKRAVGTSSPATYLPGMAVSDKGPSLIIGLPGA